MKKFDQWQLPDHEKHLQTWLTKVNDRKRGRLRYQGTKQDAALSLCKSRRTAIDIGGHVGLWSFYLAHEFDALIAFEPIEEHRQCWLENMLPIYRERQFTLHPCALGEAEAKIAMHTEPGSSGDSWVRGAGDIPMRTLDSFGFSEVDFIKADCEGGELASLKGGEQLIRTCRPVICVEQKPGKGAHFGLHDTAAVDWLQSLGYRVRKVISGDYLMTAD